MYLFFTQIELHCLKFSLSNANLFLLNVCDVLIYHIVIAFQTKYFGPINFNQDSQNNGAESSDSLQWDASVSN